MQHRRTALADKLPVAPGGPHALCAPTRGRDPLQASGSRCETGTFGRWQTSCQWHAVRGVNPAARRLSSPGHLFGFVTTCSGAYAGCKMAQHRSMGPRGGLESKFLVQLGATGRNFCKLRMLTIDLPTFCVTFPTSCGHAVNRIHLWPRTRPDLSFLNHL